MLDPLVSVCIPTYNQEKFIVDALESVLSQSYQNIEIIVVDDCSTDGTLEKLKSLCGSHEKLLLYTNKPNIGMVKNWNKCLGLSKGKYVKFVFGDDILASPDAIESMVQRLEADKEIVLVASARKIIDSSNRLQSIISSFQNLSLADGRGVIKQCLHEITRVHNPIGEPTSVMFRSDVAKRGFDVKYNQLVDIEMWFHLLEQGGFAYIDRPLCAFRQHDEQQTRKNISNLGFIDDMMLLLDSYLGKPYSGMGKLDIEFLKYYQLYKLLKHARQGKYDLSLVQDKINCIYGMDRFRSMYFFYRIYTPFWNLKRKFGYACNNNHINTKASHIGNGAR